MSSTRIEYRGRGFVAHDSIMAVWLHLLLDEIAQRCAGESCPTWLVDLADEWRIQSAADLSYCDPQLDHFLNADERRDLIISLSEAALCKLRERGPIISTDELNSMRTRGEGSFFTANLPTDIFIKNARYFVNLLKGTLGPSEHDARPLC